MGVKASAFSEPRGALCSITISCQSSAAESSFQAPVRAQYVTCHSTKRRAACGVAGDAAAPEAAGGDTVTATTALYFAASCGVMALGLLAFGSGGASSRRAFEICSNS